MIRRKIIAAAGAIAALPFVYAISTVAPATPRGTSIDAIRRRWPQFIADGAKVVTNNTPLQTELAQWQKTLAKDAFEVLFKEDTERPFSSALNDEKRRGIFVCRACDLPLFSSEMKYDSGTGWPSFFTNIPDHLDTKTDYKLIWPRTEYHCAKCGGHQGHVFDDGPAPTGERWCNNGVALRFIPASEKTISQGARAHIKRT